MPTPHLALEPLAAAQAQKHVTVNEALTRIDAATQLSVLDRDLADPPPDPGDGDRYLVAAGASGDWIGRQGDIACFDAAASGWLYLTPREGWRLWIADEQVLLVLSGGTWRDTTGLNPVAEGLLGINATADSANRLTVSSDGVLLTHDGGGTQLRLNKATTGETASLVFQTGYSGRAEIGLVGDDAFAVKVSADGASFTEALRADPLTGTLDAPEGLSIRGAAVEQIAEGFVELQEMRNRVRRGEPAATASMLMETDVTGASNLVLCSAADNNVLTIDGTYVKTLAKGEIFHGEYQPGALIRTSRGHAGASAIGGGPMPLGISGFASKLFLFYAFRSSEGNGFVTVGAGAVPATVELRDGAGTVIEDGPYSLPAFGRVTLTTPRNAEEYRVVSDRDVFCCVRGNTQDFRLIPPPATSLIGHSASSQVSALYPNTQVAWNLQNGQSGSFAVSPGAPVDFSALTGLSQSFGYSTEGFATLRASGPISAFSGADGAGAEATPFVPVDGLGQLVPLPFQSEGIQNATRSSIAVASRYEGTARIFWSDGSLATTLAILRGTNSPATASAHQEYPAAARWVPDSADFGPGGWIEADVPIFAVQNASGAGNILPTSGDEVFLPGITPEELRAEICRDDAGLLRRRGIGSGGAETWTVC